MTSPAQFQTQGAYVSPYFNVGQGAIYVGTDVDNSNASGSLCSVPYYKRGIVFLSSGAGTQAIVVPGFSAVVSLALENRGAAFTAGTFTITGRGNNGVNQNLVSVALSSLTANSIVGYANWGGAAPSTGGAYGIPDVGQNYATWTVNVTGGTGGGGFIYFLLGMIDADFSNVPGQ